MQVITVENLEAHAAPPRSRGEALTAVYQQLLTFVRVDHTSVLAITRNVLPMAGYDMLSNGTQAGPPCQTPPCGP